jgi:regulator of protease activity HflC (stomatin/prohibitin superfamily)
VEIIDVRLKRVEYVEQINNSVYERMKAERRVANELRSTGSESEKIRADADRQRAVILAEAYRDAEQIRGRAMPKRRPSTRKLSARIRSSTSSTAAWKPTAPPSRTTAT